MAILGYGEHTVDGLINALQTMKDRKIVSGNTKVYLSDTEFNGKQTMFELSKVEGEKELFLFYEMHEGMWE